MQCQLGETEIKGSAQLCHIGVSIFGSLVQLNILSKNIDSLMLTQIMSSSLSIQVQARKSGVINPLKAHASAP